MVEQVAASEAARSDGDREASLWVIALCLGLLTGLIEAAVEGGLGYARSRFMLVSPDVVWMAPAADSTILLAVALGVTIAGRYQPRLASRRVAIFVLAFLACFSVAFMFHPELHKYAGMVLAAGLAVRTERLITAQAKGVRLWAHRGVAFMLVLIVLLTVVVHGRAWLLEHRSLARRPPAAAGAANVLLIVLDTVRAQSLSVYGYSRATTPELERWANSGVRFEQALSTAPWTLPSHASMFTGHLPDALSADWFTPLDDTYPTLAEVLSAHGYVTAGFVANLWHCGHKEGLDRGFAHYEDYRITPAQLVLSASLGRYLTDSRPLRRTLRYYQMPLGRKSAAEVNHEFLRWLSAKHPQPFFAFLNYADAHGPYLPPPPFDRQFGSQSAGEWNPWMRRQHATAQRIQSMIDGYDGAIAYLDHQLGLLLAELDNRELLRDTLVIITADHGEEFGEHDAFDHGNTVYLPAAHVPLLIMFPGRVPAGARIREPVSLRNVAATILDLLGVNDGRLPGTSLARMWQGRPSDSSNDLVLTEVSRNRYLPDWLPASRGDIQSLVTSGWRYIRSSDGREELYDFEHDAAEQHDLASSQTAQQTLLSCRAVLDRALSPHAPQ